MNTNQTFHQANLAKWTAIFQEQKASGLTVKDWCAQNNVSHHAYYYWKRLAKEAYMESVLPEIVPIAMGNPLSLPATDDSSLPDTPQLPVGSHNSDSLRDLYNSCNSPDTHDTKVSVSTPSENVTLSVNGIQINIDTSASDDLIFRVLKAVRYA